MKYCTKDDCNMPRVARGMCRSHYEKWVRAGKPELNWVKQPSLRYIPEYKIFIGIKTRCYKKDSSFYKDYGGRGIKVCERWLNNSRLFIEDMGNRPSPSHSIDRIDVNGDYSPENCRWATMTQQNMNRNIISRNKSGYTGVSYSKWGWQVHVCFDYKRMYFGTYEDVKEAAYIRDQIVLQLYDGDCRTNFDYARD